MKILFLCGSAEPEKDGVGDYTRRLCGELIGKGNNIQILSLCDHQVSSFTVEYQMAESEEILVNRISISVLNKHRFKWSQEVFNKFQPDWISLQFVPYSFNAKGLPFWLPSFLTKLKGSHKWHIMFHELWLGIDVESSFKYKCIGKLQEVIVERLVDKIKPNYCTTQNKLYQFFLHSHNINAEVLPICGNIPVTAFRELATEFTQFVLFGTIHPGAPFMDFIKDLAVKKNEFIKPIKFIFIGKNGNELSNYTTVLENYGFCYVVFGIRSQKEISKVLIDSDYGISTTPYFQTEKSGVYAAYREHQINTICVSRKWTPTEGQYNIPQIIKYEKGNLNLSPKDFKVFDLHRMSAQFINSISQI